MKRINPNICNEGNHMEIIKEHIDPLKTLVRCNNCGRVTEYGNTRMISGFVGCDNSITVNGKQVPCYFGDLLPRVLRLKEENYEEYVKGKVYRWRDGADGGLE